MKIERSEFHLPKDAFILGCFSRIEKILPNVFDIWMKILNKHKDIYLALCIKDEFVKSNIKIYCDANNLIRNLIKYSDPLKKRHNHKINLKTNKYDVRFKNNIANTILI